MVWKADWREGVVVRRRMVEGGGCGKKAYGRGRGLW